MLKDTRIPPMQFREKTCLRGHRSLEQLCVEIKKPPALNDCKRKSPLI